jgi:NADPH-dependent ferric siderophore reductase
MADDAQAPGVRVRRAPPPFRRVAVARTERLTARLVRATLAGPELDGFALAEPAASVRVLLPSPGSRELVIPEWNGNEFLLPDGGRPCIRTFTPRRADPRACELDVDVVLHAAGAASAWVEAAVPGSPAAVSGPGRGYTIDPVATEYVLAGDETALAAIAQLLEALPAAVPMRAVLEVATPDARMALPVHPRATVEWRDLPPGAPPGDTLVAAIRELPLAEGTRVWAAGEAAAMQRIRRQLFDERGVARAHTAVRGYWKHGRAGDAGDPS